MMSGDATAQLILAVVPKDMVETVMSAGATAGATGATHWKGHGTGVEYETIFNALFRFPPEREVVGIVAPADLADDVFDAVSGSVPVEKPGVGFIVMLELARVAGIRNVAAV